MGSDENQSEDKCDYSNAFTPIRMVIFLALYAGGVFLSVHLYSDFGNSLAGMLVTCAVAYTFAVVVFTFQGNQITWRPYCFTCPIVVSQYPRLLIWHVGLLAVFLICEAVGFSVFSQSSTGSSNTHGNGLSPVDIVPLFLWMLAAVFAGLINRGILNQAHRDRIKDWSTDISS